MTANNHPFISILIPVYNVADYVTECMQSILAQIDERANVILMNDGSTDNSREVIEAFSSHPQVTIHDAPHNRGLSATRNALLPFATGEYVWFIDSDDVMHEGAYAKIIERLTDEPVDVLFGDYIAWRGNYRRTKRSFEGRANHVFHNDNESFFRNLVATNSNFVWCKIYKKSVIDNISYQVGKKFEDIYYMADLAEFCQTYSYLKYPLIDYREREGSIVKSMDKQYVDDFLGGYLYAVCQWQSRIDEKTHPDQDFIFYKTYSRFASMVAELDELGRQDLFDHVKSEFTPKFNVYRDQVSSKLGWLSYRKFKSKVKSVEQIFAKND
ncbi:MULTISPECIES: glycosyltransferase family 2 protein [unclassified Moraxella]|uniref:glycosyltransferase family 2 protein n=1 Tax=unclassified Moraxella TaxID=2685852 RepID=UPI003AF5E00C